MTFYQLCCLLLPSSSSNTSTYYIIGEMVLAAGFHLGDSTLVNRFSLVYSRQEFTLVNRPWPRGFF